jgi:hypothetical protein
MVLYPHLHPPSPLLFPCRSTEIFSDRNSVSFISIPVHLPKKHVPRPPKSLTACRRYRYGTPRDRHGVQGHKAFPPPLETLFCLLLSTTLVAGRHHPLCSPRCRSTNLYPPIILNLYLIHPIKHSLKMRLFLPILLLATMATASNITTDNVRDMTAAATSTHTAAGAGGVRVQWAVALAGGAVGFLVGL